MLEESFEEAPMEPMNSGPLELRRVAPQELIVRDLSYPLDDSRCILAHLTETEDDLVEVVWLQGISLPSVYLSAGEVLDDIRRHRNADQRSRRPDEIPHLPPFNTRGHRPRVA